MTTTTNPGNYVDFDEYVGLKLEKTRSTIRTTDILTAAAGVAAMFLGYLLVFVVLDQWVIRDGFGVGWRWVLLSTLILSTIGWLVWKIAIPSFLTVNRLFAAREIEKAEPELKSNLLNLIDLKSAGRTINPAILKALERRAAVRLQEVDISHAIDHRPLVRTAYLLLAVIVLFCLYALISPKKISNSIWRGLLPAAQVPLATKTEILSVKPGDLTIPAHTQSVDIQVDLGGEIPHQVMMLYTTSDGKYRREPVELRVEAEGQTRFQGRLIAENSHGLMQDITYIIKAGDAESAPYTITVEQPPSADIQTVRIEFPAYMKKPPVEQSNQGQIDAWEGATVVVTANTNMPVRSGMIQFLDDPQTGPTGEEVPMSVSGNGRQLQAQWTLALRNDGTFPKYYRIDCRTPDGRRDTAPTNHALTIRPDLPPEVVLLQPDRDIDAPVNATIPLLIQASDPDFELGYLYLNAEKGGQRILHEILSEGRQPKLLLKHDLLLSKLHVAAGDTVDLWAEVYDNKQPRPNTRNSPKIQIHVTAAVTKKEADQALAEQKERREEKMAEAERETNPEAGRQPSQPDDQSKEGKPDQENRPRESDPKREQTAENSPSSDGQSGANGDQKSENQNQDSTQQKNATGQKEGTSKNTGDPRSENTSSTEKGTGESPSNIPLSSDGSQDDEALKRLNEKLNNTPKKSEQKPSGTDPETSREKNPSNPGDGANPSKETSRDPEMPDPKSTQGDTPNKDKADATKGTETKSEKPEKTSPDGQPGKTPSDADHPDPEKAAPGNETENQTPPKPDKGNTKPKETNGNNKQPEKTEGQDPNQRPSDKPKAMPDVIPEKNGDTPSGKGADDGQDDQPVQKNKKTNPSKTDSGSETNPDQPQGKEGDEKNGSDPDSKDSKTPANKNSSDDVPSGEEKGSSQKQKTQSKPDQPRQKPGDADMPDDGPGEPVPGSDQAKKKAADGTEKGLAKPDRDQTNKPAPMKNENVKRDPNEKPETRPGDRSSQQNPTPKDKQKRKNSDPKKGTNKQNSNDQTENSNEQSDSMKDDSPAKTKSDPAGKPAKQQNSEADTQDSDSQKQKDPEKNGPSSKNSKDPAGPKNKNTAKQESSDSETGADSPSKDPANQKPGSETGDQQKSDADSQGSKSDGAKPGSQKSDDLQGEDKSANQKQDGPKPKSDPAASDKAKADGKSDSQKSDSQNSDSKSGTDKKSNSKSEGNDSGGKATSEKSSGSKSSTTKPGENNGSPKGGGGDTADGDGSATEGGDTAPVEPGDEANLEYNRQATELILQKLNKELERGDVDPELLEQLGWTKDEMKQFADRLSKSLEESKRAEESPEAKARKQQFEEMLKNLDLQKSGTQRTGATEPKRDLLQIESKRTPVPPVYKSAYEKFTRDMARQKALSGKKN